MKFAIAISALLAGASVSVLFLLRSPDAPLDAAIAVSATFDRECPVERPIGVTIANTGSRTVRSVLFTLQSSTMDARPLSATRFTDQHVLPGAQTRICLPEPMSESPDLLSGDLERLRWTATPVRASFGE